MKKLVTLTGIVSAMAMLALLAGCQTMATNSSEIAASKKQQAVSQLAQGRVSAVKYNGKLYYVYPTTKKDQIFVGRQKQYNAYKQALANQQGQQQMAGTPTFVTETAGPNHIEVDQFNGFGPMGTETMGNW